MCAVRHARGPQALVGVAQRRVDDPDLALAGLRGRDGHGALLRTVMVSDCGSTRTQSPVRTASAGAGPSPR